MELFIKSLQDSKVLPLPNLPVVEDYAPEWGMVPHDIMLFPALLRSKEVLRPESILEDGQASCYFHDKIPATAICDVSGRMICDLCTTEFEGKTVSFEGLQSLVLKNGSSKNQKVHHKWDSIALALALFPIIVWFITVITAPLALGICIFKWKEGPTGIIPRNRWRYLVAGLLSLGQMVMWVLIFTGIFADFL